MRAYGGQATITIAIAAFVEAPAEDGRDHHREDDRREREHEVGAAHAEPVERAAEVAGDRADDRADRRGADDDEERERQRHPGAVEHAAEDVAAELVGSEQVRPGRPHRRREVLRERIGGRDQRREDRDDHPQRHDHETDDGKRLAEARMDPAGAHHRAGAEDAGGHVTRIRGSMTP